jgi:hypothetical protein
VNARTSDVLAKPNASTNLKQYIEKLVAGQSLTKNEAASVCEAILSGAEPIQVVYSFVLSNVLDAVSLLIPRSAQGCFCAYASPSQW